MNKYKYTGKLPILSKAGILVAANFDRIVHGGRGDYVEFSDEQMAKDNLFVPDLAAWRFYSNLCYYIEYAVKNDVKVKVYHQLKTVDYADYIIGKWYISPVKLKDFEVEK
jgi:hypothetical protein